LAGKRPWPLQIEFVFRASAAKLEILVDFDVLRLSGGQRVARLCALPWRRLILLTGGPAFDGGLMAGLEVGMGV